MYQFGGTPTKLATFLAAVSSGRQRMWVQAVIQKPTGTLVTLPQIVSGSVTVTETAEFRRTCTLTIVSKGRTAGTDLVPVNPGDLLHPATANALIIYRGIIQTTGAALACPLGIFRMSSPKITDTDTGILITINGNTLASKIARQAFTTYFTIAAGTKLVTAIKQLLENRTPSLKTPGRLVLAAATYNGTPWTVPAQSFFSETLENVTETDPWQSAQNMAAAAGQELFFNVTGQVIMRPIPTPTEQPVLLTFTTGEEGTITKSVTRTLTESKEYNGVLAIGVGAGNGSGTYTNRPVPVRATLWTTTPESPTYAGTTATPTSAGYNVGPWGRVPYIFRTTLVPAPTQSTASAQAQINAIAKAQFKLVCTVLDTPSFYCVPNPALQEGDCIKLVRPRLGISGNYVISGMVIPLTATAPMQINLRGPRRSVPGVTTG